MYIGIDVGGMSIKAGLVDEKGKLICKHSVKTPLDGNDAFCEAMAEAVRGVIKKADYKGEIIAIGIGAPGVVDREKGFLVYSCNIPYQNAPVGKYLTKEFDVPVLVENDANSAALGEFYAAEDARNFIFITLGTGVGGGIVIDGKLYTGSNGVGGELGHIVTHAGGRKCGCGRLGCWEAYASTSGLIKLTEENRDKIASIGKDEIITGKTVFDAAEKGDKEAIRVRDEWVKEVAIGLADVVNIFQPDEVVVGGAVSNQGEVILGPVREFVYKEEYTSTQPNVKKAKIINSRIGDDAGIIGAALLWKNKNE